MTDLYLQPESSPSVLDRAVIFQGDAVDVLYMAERTKLQAQFEADAGRMAVTAQLSLARQQVRSARLVADAWTKAVRTLLDMNPGEPADDLLTPVHDDVDLEEPTSDRPAADLEADLVLDLDDPEDLEWTPEAWNTPDRLTLRERAHSFAQTMALRYDWADGVEALTDVLERPRWGKLHLSIEHLIQQGMTPDEFGLAHALRGVFQERPELNVTPCRKLHRTVYASPALRWSTALDLARTFPGHDPEFLLTRTVGVCHQHAPEHRFSCWSDRLSLLLDGFPEGVDGDYWLTVLEER